MTSTTARTRYQKKRDAHPTQKKKTQKRVKRPRKQEITDPRAKKVILRIKMGSMANTRHTRKGQKVAVKAVRKGGQKAEGKDTSTKRMRKGHCPKVRTLKRTLRKINILNPIMGKKNLNMMNPEKSIKMMLKEEMVKEQDLNLVARTKP